MQTVQSGYVNDLLYTAWPDPNQNHHVGQKKKDAKQDIRCILLLPKQAKKKKKRKQS